MCPNSTPGKRPKRRGTAAIATAPKAKPDATPPAANLLPARPIRRPPPSPNLWDVWPERVESGSDRSATILAHPPRLACRGMDSLRPATRAHSVGRKRGRWSGSKIGLRSSTNWTPETLGPGHSEMGVRFSPRLPVEPPLRVAPPSRRSTVAKAQRIQRRRPRSHQ